VEGETTQGLLNRTPVNPPQCALVSAARLTTLGIRTGEVQLLATSDERLLLGGLGLDVRARTGLPPRQPAGSPASRTTIGSALLVGQRKSAGVGMLDASETCNPARVRRRPFCAGV
jgi:hypothetical protein